MSASGGLVPVALPNRDMPETREEVHLGKMSTPGELIKAGRNIRQRVPIRLGNSVERTIVICLLYTSDAADE